MPMFETKLAGGTKADGKPTPTGIEVPPAIVAALGTSKKPAVKVTINGSFTYQSTVASMGGKFMIPVSAERRDGAGIKAGDAITVDLELETSERTVDLPADFAKALAANKKAKAAFDKLAFTYRKEYARAIEDAKKPETRLARIERTISKLSG